MSEQKPLWAAQRDTAAELPWYRAWLASTCEHPAIEGGYQEPAGCVRCGWTSEEDFPPPSEPKGRAYRGYRCRRREHQWCRGRWGRAHCICPCHEEEP